MNGAVFVRRFPAPPLNPREVLRYAGTPELSDDLTALLESVWQEAQSHLLYCVCWREISLMEDTGVPIPGFSPESSAALRQHMPRCSSFILFAATLGMEFDRLVARYSRSSPARALMLQALGAERIEALCDAFCKEMGDQAGKKGLHPLPRFSPGYGGLPLTLQREIFLLLDCPRRIGLTLNDSLLMSPVKSVTAFVGLGTCPAPNQCGGCVSCSKTDCAYRRTL